MLRQPSIALHAVQRPNIKVYGWGRNDLSQLGLLLVATQSAVDEDGQQQHSPQSMEVDMTAGHSSAADCALLPVCVDLLANKDVVHVAAGAFNSAFLSAEGEVYTCGASDSLQLGVKRRDGHDAVATGVGGSPVVRVDALDMVKVVHVTYGQEHALAVTDKGTVMAWGTGEYGQLSMGPNVTSQAHPRLIKGLTKSIRFARVAAGAYHSAAVTSSGQLYTWGQGSWGALGHGDEENVEAPKHVQRLWHEGVTQVSCGETHTVVITADGRVFSMGRGKYGALGCGEFRSSPVPLLVKALKGIHIKQIACGGDHTLALSHTGQVYAWGKNSCGQLGLGSTDNTCSPNRVMGALESHLVVQVAAGLRHSACLTASNRILVWGSGEQGQLGNAHTRLLQLSPLPLPEMVLPNMPVKYIAAGGDHLFAVLQEPTAHEQVAEVMVGPSPSSASQPDLHAHGLGMLPLSLPDLQALTRQAAAELTSTAERGRVGVAGVGLHSSGVGSAVAQILAAVEDVFTSPGYLAAFFDRPAGSRSNSGTNSDQDMLAAANQRCGVKAHTLDVDAINDVYQGLLRLYSPEVVTCLGNACATLLDNMEHFLRQGNECSVGPEEGSSKKFKAVAKSDQQNWLQGTALLPALFVLAQNPLNLHAAGVASPPTSPSGSAMGISLWSKLATVINLLPNVAQKTLRFWLASLPPDIFGGRVLRPLQAHITRCAERSMHRWRPDILAAGKVLQQLYTAHSSLVEECYSWGSTALLGGSQPSASGLYELPSTEWNNKAVSENANLKEEYMLYVQLQERMFGHHMLESTNLISFCQIPVLFTPEAKSRILQTEANVQKQHIVQNLAVHAILQGINPHVVVYLDVHVRRSNVMQDALQQIMARPEDLKKPLRITFIGPSGVPEEGLDEGGVSREFFQLLVAEIFREEYGMFVWSEETRTFWFNPCSLESELEFKLVGAVLGLAIYNNIILDVHLPMVTYKKLLGHKPGWRDLCEAQPSLARGLAGLLSFEGDVENTFCRTFEVEYDYFGETRRKELMPGGANVPVTQHNRQQYVELYTKWVLEDSIQSQFMAFLQGFHQVCGGPALGLMSSAELELLVCGLPHLDFAALEQGAKYEGGYDASTPVVRWFWSELQAMTLEQKKRFLMFTTGCDRAPVGGLGKLTLVIQRSGPDDNRLPTAHTCFNVIILPEYSSQAKLKERLLTAINNAQGFGLQ